MDDALASSFALRARVALGTELTAIAWWRLLTLRQQAELAPHIQVARAEPGESICRRGRPATSWFGVLDGLLKVSSDESSGMPPITFSGIAPGAWFGEGTLLRRETYRHDVVALRRSLLVGLPLAQFETLLASSIPFNRYLLDLLNERLMQCVAAREAERSPDPDLRVARNLAALTHPLLQPGVGGLLRITQQELAQLVSLSRQRVNQALQQLQDTGAIRVEYGGLRVLDRDKLQRFERKD